MSAETREAICREFLPKIHRYIAARVHHPQEAEDLVSEVFLRVCQKFDSFDETKASVSTWVYAIAKNAVIDYYRARRIHDELTPMLASAEDPERDLIHSDLLGTLASALTRLDERRRDILILRYYKGLTLRQIAARMNLSYSYIKLLHTDALAQLQRSLC